MKPIIKIENLSKRYRIGSLQTPYHTLRETLTRKVRAPLELFRSKRRTAKPWVWALKDIGFEVEPGEVLGIIGRNGAGKSTLLKVLSRITEPTTGRVILYGRVGSLLEVGTGFHPELTGRENIFLNATVLGMRRGEIRGKFDEIVAFAEIEKFIDTPVKRYSTGMYLRLAFAVAAHLEPEILVVDEVLAVGDMQFQKKCLGKMQDVSRAGRTILFVSHDMSAIVKLCSRALLLNQGQMVTHGPATDVVSQYLNTALGASGTTVWSGERQPGTGGFKLISVSLLDESEVPISVVNIEQATLLRIAYYTSVPNFKFRCAARFYTQGTCAFIALEPVETVRRQSGLYYSTVHIDGNLFAEGDYTVGISVFASRGKKLNYCLVDDVIAFQVYDPVTGGSARGDYAEGLVGVMRPRLDWETQYAGRESVTQGAAQI
jgi:lipopolysaccharide transport system ATP-binding protein